MVAEGVELAAALALERAAVVLQAGQRHAKEAADGELQLVSRQRKLPAGRDGPRK